MSRNRFLIFNTIFELSASKIVIFTNLFQFIILNMINYYIIFSFSLDLPHGHRFIGNRCNQHGRMWRRYRRNLWNSRCNTSCYSTHNPADESRQNLSYDGGDDYLRASYGSNILNLFQKSQQAEWKYPGNVFASSPLLWPHKTAPKTVINVKICILLLD